MRFADNPAMSASGVATNDILVGTDVSDGTDKKITFSNLGKWIISTYAGETIAGDQQPVKFAVDDLKTQVDGIATDIGGIETAVDTLSSNSYMDLGTSIASSDDLNLFIDVGKYSASSSVAATLSHCPTTVGFSMYVELFTSSGKKQTVIDNNGDTFTRVNISGNTTSWSAWREIPAESEITAITSQIGVFRRAVSTTVAGGTTYDATGLASGIYIVITARTAHTSTLYDGFFLCSIGGTNSHMSTILAPSNLTVTVGAATITATNNGTAQFALIIYRV